MEQFPPDDILESLYKLRIRESEKLKTVLELYNLENRQKKAKPDYRRLKSNGRIESNMLVKNQREQRHVLEGQGDCWQWKVIGQCSKGDNCSFGHDANERAKPTTQPAPSPEHSKSQDVKDSAKRKVLEAEAVWENHSHAMQGSSEVYLRESLL